MSTPPADGPVSRFAPSPNGRLHLGHAFSALVAYHLAADFGGRFILRIEDIDTSRARPEFEQAIYDDLAWLGLKWDTPVRRQSEHFSEYEAALAALRQRGLVYPCFCTRKEIAKEVARAHAAPHGPEGPLYPGTCRALTHKEAEARIAAGESHCLRLNTGKAASDVAAPLTWHDFHAGEVTARPEELGDVVLARKDIPTSYHLSVVLDDALEGITVVARGEDLFHATHIHRLLQALLDLPTPAYHHHAIIRDEEGERMAKRIGSTSLADLRAAGWSRLDVLRTLHEALEVELPGSSY